MRAVLVGTDLAPAREGAGALESLLWAWSAGLAGAGHDVHLVSVGSVGAAGGGADRPGGPTDGTDLARGADPPAPAGVTAHRVDTPGGLTRLAARLRPEAVLLNNRPAWGRLVGAPVVHLFHNWPDAWGVTEGGADLGRAGAAAVSGALAVVVGSSTGRPAAGVTVVPPIVPAVFLEVAPRPETGLALSPNRLLAKKGVRELAAASRHLAPGWRVHFTDHFSPWPAPTAEHRALRRVVVQTPRCELIPARRGPAAMADLYAGADVVVVPSVRPEGLGMTAVEAQACGVPVVTSGRGGLAEATLCDDLVADPGRPALLAAAIERAGALDGEDRAALRAAVAARYAPSASMAALVAALGTARVP